MQFAEDIGAIKSGIASLETSQARTEKKITGLQQAVSGLVAKEDCREHRQRINGRVDALQGPDRTAAVAAESRASLLEKLGKNAGALTAIITLVGIMVGGAIATARLVASVEAVLDKERRASSAQMTQILDEVRKQPEPVVVHEKVYVQPDAGPAKRRQRKRRPQ